MLQQTLSISLRSGCGEATALPSNLPSLTISPGRVPSRERNRVAMMNRRGFSLKSVLALSRARFAAAPPWTEVHRSLRIGGGSRLNRTETVSVSQGASTTLPEPTLGSAASRNTGSAGLLHDIEKRLLFPCRLMDQRHLRARLQPGRMCP